MALRPCRTPPLSQLVYREADRIAPRRNRGGDGTCPSAAHHAQNPDSDHEPFYGQSHAIDLTHDPARGFDAHRWARVVAGNVRAGLETRVKYLISNGQIAENGVWRPFSGEPHRGHWHTSWKRGVVGDTRPFLVDKTGGGAAPAPPEDDDVKLWLIDPTRDPLPNGWFPSFKLEPEKSRVVCFNGANLVGARLVGGVRVWPIANGTGTPLEGMDLQQINSNQVVLDPPVLVVFARSGATFATRIRKP